ncbi:MAG: Gfo/Idh/MocA family oxidoreductase [Patescibacteria group bacterium]
MKYSIAIIGIGRQGKNLLREFKTVAHVAYAFGKKDLKLSRALKDHYVEAVVVATPIKTHFSIARRALLAGKHVFLEKPMTDNVSQARALVKLAQKQKRSLFIGHTFLYHPIFEKIKEINKRDPIISTHFEWHKLGSFHEDIKWNLLVHDVALLLTLWSKPIHLKLLYKKTVIGSGDILSAEFFFSKNRKATVNINRASSIKRKAMTFITKKQNIYLWENDILLKLDKKNNLFKEIFESKNAALGIECGAFLRTIKEKSDGSFGARVIEVWSKLK